jgi:hypothetical protein
VPICRYERASPGELIHIDIKKLGRFEQIGHRITGERTAQSRGGVMPRMAMGTVGTGYTAPAARPKRPYLLPRHPAARYALLDAR